MFSNKVHWPSNLPGLRINEWSGPESKGPKQALPPFKKPRSLSRPRNEWDIDYSRQQHEGPLPLQGWADRDLGGAVEKERQLDIAGAPPGVPLPRRPEPNLTRVSWGPSIYMGYGPDSGLWTIGAPSPPWGCLLLQIDRGGGVPSMAAHEDLS
ncbi:hypothetical protein SUGI_1523220 [Cryptomeria japonica]|uniref:Uncharacterized protein n=1 Tax=Cryptomeria japonica TaxID=3369 RepID=A0AAD3RRZ4_CRYJA|nr:hypothetical protein SUGI_1503570 [Cryptomeria japonica]GLJ59788.1 hypothetical protein SUGI_1523220 [Cryptomeria japonica]